MDLNLQGQSVIRVCFDTALTVLTSDDCELRVETDAIIKRPDEGAVPFDPESPGTAAVQLVQLIHDAITLAEVGSLGNLVIEFESGAELSVTPHAEYEAWGLVGPSGRRVTCMPGGEVALWDERQA
ncbi:DUF6188 family protein [Streptomyces milbemycinicus]|uniref:DUF6188 family protein n=1 Tax=Streptomyces milbemycinicus TaxID=476552 RepID=UPI0033C43374